MCVILQMFLFFESDQDISNGVYCGGSYSFGIAQFALCCLKPSVLPRLEANLCMLEVRAVSLVLQQFAKQLLL
jgi:hypothetical protein